MDKKTSKGEDYLFPGALSESFHYTLILRCPNINIFGQPYFIDQGLTV